MLEKECLLSKIENPKSRHITHHINADIITPHQITQHLWQWLIEYHLESKQLVEWAIEKQVLHPLFITFLENELFRKPPVEPFLTFWRIFILDLNSHGSRQDTFHQIDGLNNNRDKLNLLSLSKLLKPKIKFSKPFVWGNEDSIQPYKAEVEISIEGYEFIEITKYASELTDLLLPITSALKQAMELWQLLGQADEKYDTSYWGLPSISPHHQNHRFDNWLLLIELCRDIWQATYKTNKALALAIIELWKTITFPIFKRLVFHAYTISDIVNLADKLNYLLVDNNWWLWSVTSQRETFRLLAVLCPQLTITDLIQLEQAIISGSPREMYRDDLTDEEYQETKEHQIWLRLAKLESFGVNLTENTKIIYQQLSEKHPNWQLQEDERDEFSHWSSESIGWQCNLVMDDFVKLTPEQQVEALLKPSDDSFERNQTRFFNSICKDKPSIGLETLNYLAQHSNWNAEIWHAGLMGLSETKVQWSEVAKLIVQFPNVLFEKESWVIAWWINKTISSVEENSADEQYFWRIFDLLISQAQSKDIDSNTKKNINYAINRPIGILTEALLNRFSIRKINNMEKITDVNLLACVNKLVHGDDALLLPAKIILISRLYYFYAIDSDWTRINLIPLLDWKKSTNAAIFWQGFLWNSSISADLAAELKNYFLVTLLKHNKELGEDGDRLIKLFVDICFSYQTIYSVSEQRQVLNSVGIHGLEKISEFISHTMRSDKKENDQYWIKRIKPFFQKTWSRDAESLSPEISKHFTLMCVALDEEFEDAVKIIEVILTPFENISFLLSQLKKSEHIAKHPVITFELLANIFDPNMKYWSIGKFKEVFDDLVTQEPSLKKHQKYQEMNHVLVKACS